MSEDLHRRGASRSYDAQRAHGLWYFTQRPTFAGYLSVLFLSSSHRRNRQLNVCQLYMGKKQNVDAKDQRRAKKRGGRGITVN
jgi:hypothetical protein